MGLFLGLVETVWGAGGNWLVLDTVKFLTPVNFVWVLKAITVEFCLPVGTWSYWDKQYTETCPNWA